MRDKLFVINSIKMDLYRVITVAGDITQPPRVNSIKEFLHHAEKDFNKIRLTEREKLLRDEVVTLTKDMKKYLKDPSKRLKWAEKILTIRCRL